MKAPLSSSSMRTISSAARPWRAPAGWRRRAAARRAAAVSSISAGRKRIGLDAGLIDEREPARRAGGEDELGPADHDVATRGWLEWGSIPKPSGLLEPVGDAAFAEIIGRHLDQDLVAGQHANPVLAHAAGGMAMISCPTSSFTRKVAFGSSSVTTPGNSSSSSFAIRRPASWSGAVGDRSGSHGAPKSARNLAEGGRVHNCI